MSDRQAGVKIMDRGIMALVGAFVVVGGLGAILIGVGGLVLKYVLNFMVAQMGGPPPATLVVGRQEELLLWVNIVLYVPAGVVLVVLGLGTIRCKRWARTLMESISALMTLVGIVGFFVSLLSLLVMPEFFRTFLSDSSPVGVDEGLMSMMLLFVVLFVLVGAFFYIGIPATLWWFYRLRSVRSLCEMWDPREGWLDRNPPLVNALVMVNGAGIFLCLPFFVLEVETGMDWPVVPTVLAAICIALLAASVGLARLCLWGWMLEMALALGLSIFGSWWVLTASTRGLVEWYFGVIGFNELPEFNDGAFVIFDMISHFVIWGSSLPVIYILCTETGSFYDKKTPPSFLVA